MYKEFFLILVLPLTLAFLAATYAHTVRERCDAGEMSQGLRNAVVEYRWDMIDRAEFETAIINVAKQLESCEEFKIDYKGYYDER